MLLEMVWAIMSHISCDREEPVPSTRRSPAMVGVKVAEAREDLQECEDPTSSQTVRSRGRSRVQFLSLLYIRRCTRGPARLLWLCGLLYVQRWSATLRGYRRFDLLSPFLGFVKLFVQGALARLSILF